MFIMSPFFVFCSSVVLFLVLVVIVYRLKIYFNQVNKGLQTQLESQEILLSELQSSQNILKDQLIDLNVKHINQNVENEQVNKQLEHRIKTVQNESREQNKLLEQLLNQQPQDKLYSRAFKLVELGADVEEVVRECEIPLAEAEMLISVHRNKTNPY